MRFQLVTDPAQYRNFLSLHPQTSFLQSWDWGEFQTAYGRRAHRIAVIDDKENWQAVGQFLEMPLPLGGYHYLYCPRGPVGDDSASFATTEFQNFLTKKFPRLSFVKFEPDNSSGFDASRTQLLSGSRIQPGKTLLTNLALPEETLLTNMHHKTRYNIKVAEKRGVKVDLHTTADSYSVDGIISLLTETSSHHGYRNHPVGYFRKLAEHYHHQSTDSRLVIATATINQELAATAMLIDFGNTRTYLFGGSNYEQRSAMAPYLMHWHAMQDARNQSLQFYDWWGIETSSGQTPGFVRFKLGWSGNEVSYPPAYELSVNFLAHKTYRLAKSVSKFFKG